MGRLKFVCVLLVALVTVGCAHYTKEEGMALAERVNSLEEGLDSERARFREQIAEAQTRLEQLDEVNQRVTQGLRRSGADLGAELTDVRQEVSSMNGQIAELRNLMQQLQQEQARAAEARAQANAPPPPVQIPEARQEHFAQAYRAYSSNDHDRARTLFEAYARRYPEDTETDNALYWIGQSHLNSGDPRQALGTFGQVIRDHGDGDAVDDTLLSMAEAFYRVRDCNNSKTTLRTLIRSHRRSPLVAQARQRLEMVEADAQNFCTQ